MKKYILDRIDTHLRLSLNHMERDQLKQLTMEVMLLLVEVHRLESNRVKRYKNLKQRATRSKVMTLVEKQLESVIR